MSKANPIGSQKFLERLRRWKGFYEKNLSFSIFLNGVTPGAFLSAPLLEKYRFFLAQIILRQQRQLWNDDRLRFEFALRFLVAEKERTARENHPGRTAPKLNFFLDAPFAETTNVFLKNIISPAAHWHKDSRVQPEVRAISSVPNLDGKPEEIPRANPMAAMLYLRSGDAVHAHHGVNHAVELPARSNVQAVAPGRSALPQPRLNIATAANIQAQVPVARVWANKPILFSDLRVVPMRSADVSQQNWRSPALLRETAKPQEILGSLLYRRVEMNAGALEKNGNRGQTEKAVDLTHRRSQSAPETAPRETPAFFRSPDLSARDDSSATLSSERQILRAGRVVGLAESAHDNRMPEVSRMVEEVYALLEKKLRTERERRGLFA